MARRHHEPSLWRPVVRAPSGPAAWPPGPGPGALVRLWRLSWRLWDLEPHRQTTTQGLSWARPEPWRRPAAPERPTFEEKTDQTQGCEFAVRGAEPDDGAAGLEF